MDDALADIIDVEHLDAVFGAVLPQRLDLKAGVIVFDGLCAIRGRHVVVDDGQRQVRPARFPSRIAQSFEGLRAGDFVNQMTIDIDQAGAIVLHIDQVGVPDLVEKSFRSSHMFQISSLECFKRRPYI